MKMTTPTLPTANEAWGFYGTASGFADATKAWTIAFPAVLAATEGTAEGVRDFLDSRHGRHFADDVHNGVHAGLDLMAAIEAAITRWMGWTLDRQTAREISMPKGLPYLKGFVLSFSLQAQAA
jgi:hypothetical protein